MAADQHGVDCAAAFQGDMARLAGIDAGSPGEPYPALAADIALGG